MQQHVQQPMHLAPASNVTFRLPISGNDLYRPVGLEFASRGKPLGLGPSCRLHELDQVVTCAGCRLRDSIRWRLGRLSPALPEPALLLLVAFGCNVMISCFGYGGQHEATAKETPMKVTKKARSRKIVKIATFGFLTTVANVAAALAAATSG